MTRVEVEREHWDNAALDPDVGEKYISNLDVNVCKDAVGKCDGTVLDLGCGVGRLMEDGYHGIDISQNMLNIANKRMPKCVFHLCDGRTIPYVDGIFDKVYSVLLFQHLPLEAVFSYMRESYRVLKYGRVFRFQFITGVEDEPFSKHYNKQMILNYLSVVGFNIVRIDESLIHNSWTWVTGYKI